ncbi:MAG: C40 family peptidase [Bacteroidales bacterium]|nr:C40 family peptidase [Bacteroidales bacterium]
MKRWLILAIGLCTMGQLWAQGVITGRAPWNNHAWTVSSATVPLLRETVEQFNNTPDTADRLIEEARRHLGKPYHYGGKGPKAFDCAGFARYVYLQFGYTLPGGSAPQYRLGRHIKETKKLQRGDLVFWQGRSGKGGVGHTGIVTEVDTNTGVFRFIHAATSTGVIHSYSNEAYYSRRYIGATRLLGDRKKPETPLPRRK